MEYDVIGDLHGHAGALKALLVKLGYRERTGAWRHPTRTAIFVGDFIDRGPDQLETVHIVRTMVEAGAALAVMGNHEFNALAWHTFDPDKPGAYLRTHDTSHRHQHQAFLDAIEGRPDDLKSCLDWFRILPLWLELPGLRVVHACWHEPSIAFLQGQRMPGSRLSEDVLVAASRNESPAFRALAMVLKGPEVAFPAGLRLRMGDAVRGAARTRWWDQHAASLRASAIVEPGDRPSLPDDVPVPPALRPGYVGDRPLFIGHYWMRGQPALLAPRVACVDYSAGRGRPLVAYRWHGERDLDGRHFISSTGDFAGTRADPAAA